MRLGLEEMLQLMRDVESEDPLDWGNLSMDEEGLRRLVMADLLQRDQQLQQMASPEECQLIYLLSTARLVLENLVLNLRLHAQDPSAVKAGLEMQALLRKLGRGE